jgi:myosin heavy subunit
LLQSLFNDLEETQLHYIRCIKLNLRKASHYFAAGKVSNEKEELTVSIDGFKSCADLERKIVDLQSQIKQAIARKDFKEASSLQSILDGHKKLQENFLSVEELQMRVQHAIQELDDAVASKDFAKAGELIEKIDMLNNKVESEKSEIGEAMEVTGGKTQTFCDISGLRGEN